MKYLAVITIACAAVMCACDGTGSMLPKSGGRPYEVVLVASDRECGDMIDSVLSCDAEGLPQPEPNFDVTLRRDMKSGDVTRFAGNVVIVTADPEQFTSVRIRYEKNVWAKPQMVAYVNTPSAAELEKHINAVGRQLSDLLERAEMNKEIRATAKGADRKTAERIRRMFGWDIDVPAEMNAGKRGKDFLWLSDNAASGMRNICIYSYGGTSFDGKRAVEVRDSVMRTNIPGEERGMYMTTVSGSVGVKLVKENGQSIMICRGLWEMRNDAMGGPFVSHSVIDTANNRIIVAEAFVYAPEMKKRNLMRKTEAVLYTLRKVGLRAGKGR